MGYLDGIGKLFAATNVNRTSSTTKADKAFGQIKGLSIEKQSYAPNFEGARENSPVGQGLLPADEALNLGIQCDSQVFTRFYNSANVPSIAAQVNDFTG